MATDVSLFEGGNLPAYLKNRELDDVTKNLIGGGIGGKRISIRGNVFRLMVNGKEIAKNENRTMNVVIANAAPDVSRQYYAGAYDADNPAAPDCWSNDGKYPDAQAANKQSDNCANCPQNIKGSGQGDSRACRFQQRLAVVMENDLQGDVFQLTLPSQSIFGKGEGGKLPLRAYGQYLAGFNVPVTAVVTEMRFDTDSATPKLTFKAVRPLTEEEYKVCRTQGDSPEAKAAITMTVAQADGVTKTKEQAKPKAEVKTAAPEKTEPEKVEPEQEPQVRKGKKQETVAPKKDLASVLASWDDE